MIFAFFKKKAELKTKQELGFLKLKTLINEICFIERVADFGQDLLWYELDNLRQDFIYSNPKFFEFIEQIEKLLVKALNLKRKISSEILHKRSAENLIRQEKEILEFLNILLQERSYFTKLSLKKKLKKLLKSYGNFC